MSAEFAYTSTVDVAQAAAMLRSAPRIAVLTHWKPDGDAMGSLLAITRALRAIGADVQPFVAGPMDPNVLALAAPGEVLVAPAQMPGPDRELAVVVDTGAWSQLDPFQDWLRGMRGRVLGLDHHARGDEVADSRIVDTRCASATQVVASVVDALGVPFAGAEGARGSIAEAVFAGLATDTGWFRFKSADSAVFALASRLLALGVDNQRLVQLLDENERPPRLGMMARALASIEYAGGGTAAIMHLGPDDFSAAHARQEDIGGIVNAPMVVGSVRVSVLLTQVPGEGAVTKISFRSKPAVLDGQRFTDVNQLAAEFGGGGHAQAAGARLDMPVAGARERIRAAVERAVAAAIPVQSGRTRA
jgi:phosphoesterase RecJ-like protein